MKFVKQLTLVTAIAAASTGAMAMEALSDEALSQKTGQDGITVTITPSATGISIQKLLIHDNDGLAAANISYNGGTVANGGTGKAGAIVVNNLKIKGGEIGVTVDTDAGAGGTAPFLNAAVSMDGTTTISLDGVNIGASGTATPAYTGANQRGATNESKILGALSLDITDASMNVQLGAQPQGAMVLMDATITDGLKIGKQDATTKAWSGGLEIVDSNGYAKATTPAQGGLLVSGMTLTNATTKDMSLAQKIDIDANDGIVITMDSPTGGYYGYLTDVGISDGNGTLSNTIGDVEIIGLDMGSSTIAIKGH